MSAGLMAAAVAETAVITYRAFGRGLKVPDDAPMAMPLPASYTAVVLVFGALAMVPGQAGQVAALVGWGLVVATTLNLWVIGADGKSKVSATPSLATKG